MWSALLGLYVVLTLMPNIQSELKLSKITMDPAVARIFPSAQVSAACRIVTINGLSTLDGDYVLVDSLNITETKPAWVGTSAFTQGVVLSFRSDHRAWVIGVDDLAQAFLDIDSEIPPARSSQWQVFNPELSAFERAGKGDVTILCPACTAVVVSMLPDALKHCNGPYRLQVANHGVGIFAWSHVSDERCTMLHDQVGNSIVAMENQAKTGQHPSSTTPFQAITLTENKWAEILDKASFPSIFRRTTVTCTSAGQTTSVVLDLMDSGVRSDEGNTNGEQWKAIKSTGESFKLDSRQDGSVVSSSYSSVHIRVSLAEKLKLADTAAGGGALAKELLVHVSIDGDQSATIPLETAITQGVFAAFDGTEGTHLIEVFLLDKQIEVPGDHPSPNGLFCAAQTAFVLEIFPAETQLIQRRFNGEIAHPQGTLAGGTVVDEENLETRIAFVVDLEVVDGYKLSTVHLLRHLPNNFRPSLVDLSCASGELPMKDIFDNLPFDLIRQCIMVPKEVWNIAQDNRVSMSTFFYTTLVNATTWDEVNHAHPEVARALGELYDHLTAFDALVMSNGGRDNDAYLLQVARLAGVPTRIVNLGALAGGYMSPFFSGATALIGPSHYVAHKPTVVRNAGALPIKICHPVMDANRVLEAARSCCPLIALMPHDGHGRSGAIGCESSEELTKGDRHSIGTAATDVQGELQPVKFIMVGRVSSEKTPSVFVRAMAILQRRWTDGLGRKRRAEGVVVGKGPLLKHMEGLARKLNSSVTFSGFLPADAVPCEVQQATALVLPSTGLETFGMVGPEAMLLGVPVITFGFGGSGELVRHMENGVLVTQPTPRALADAMEMIARDPLLRDRLGEQARQDALRALSLSDMVACHADEFGRHTKFSL